MREQGIAGLQIRGLGQGPVCEKERSDALALTVGERAGGASQVRVIFQVQSRLRALIQKPGVAPRTRLPAHLDRAIILQRVSLTMQIWLLRAACQSGP